MKIVTIVKGLLDVLIITYLLLIPIIVMTGGFKTDVLGISIRATDLYTPFKILVPLVLIRLAISLKFKSPIGSRIGYDAASEHQWRRFVTTMVGIAAGIVGLLLISIIIVDPHDQISFSPPLDRAPINENQRFTYPAMAKDPSFDSVVLGTSTSMLLRPEAFNRLMGGRFVNLSMAAATAYEQARLFELFNRHHETIRHVIIGIDVVWCEIDEEIQKYMHLKFPEWMYDDSVWNDLLHMLNPKTVEQVGRQLQYLTGWREPTYGPDGYLNFLPPDEEYDLERAQKKLYGEKGPRKQPRPARLVNPTAAERDSWHFPTHALMSTLLQSTAEDTVKILVFVPYHDFAQPPEGTIQHARWQECKHRMTRLAESVPNAHVLDFMISSDITSRDEHYWDSSHYSLAIADRLVPLIAQGIRKRRSVPGAFVYLGGPKVPGQIVDKGRES